MKLAEVALSVNPRLYMGVSQVRRGYIGVED